MSDFDVRKARPEFRNIAIGQIITYRLPVSGIVSILHRISGALLFLFGLPFILFLFDQSITSELSFQRYRAVVSSVPGKLCLVVVGWAFFHHAIAGVRYLLLDLHIGLSKGAAILSAKVVMGLSLVLTAILALKIFALF